MPKPATIEVPQAEMAKPEPPAAKQPEPPALVAIPEVALPKVYPPSTCYSPLPDPTVLPEPIETPQAPEPEVQGKANEEASIILPEPV